MSTESSVAINAFDSICLKSAPTFNDAEKIAAEFGIAELADAGFMKMGFNKDKSLGVQIKPNKECVVTTPSQNNPSLTQQFIKVVSSYSGVAPSRKVPFGASIKGVGFIFHHDRNGGEALVMLNPNG
jgi:hypothetical protein